LGGTIDISVLIIPEESIKTLKETRLASFIVASPPKQVCRKALELSKLTRTKTTS